MNGEELTRRRDRIDELARRLERGDITQEFYDNAFREQYEIEKKYGLLVPGGTVHKSGGKCYVKPHTTKSGTHVKGYYRKC